MALTDQVPPWAETLATLALGAGGAKILAVWLENRRLTRREYRETLERRVQDLERQVAGLFERVGSYREEVAHLEERLKAEQVETERLKDENDELRGLLQDCKEVLDGLPPEQKT